MRDKFERKTFKLLIGGSTAMLAVCRGIKMIYDMFLTVKTDRKYKV